MCEWKCASEMECASASLVNVRVARFSKCASASDDVLVVHLCHDVISPLLAKPFLEFAHGYGVAYRQAPDIACGCDHRWETTLF